MPLPLYKIMSRLLHPKPTPNPVSNMFNSHTHDPIPTPANPHPTPNNFTPTAHHHCFLSSFILDSSTLALQAKLSNAVSVQCQQGALTNHPE